MYIIVDVLVGFDLYLWDIWYWKETYSYLVLFVTFCNSDPFEHGSVRWSYLLSEFPHSTSLFQRRKLIQPYPIEQLSMVYEDPQSLCPTLTSVPSDPHTQSVVPRVWTFEAAFPQSHTISDLLSQGCQVSFIIRGFTWALEWYKNC